MEILTRIYFSQTKKPLSYHCLSPFPPKKNSYITSEDLHEVLGESFNGDSVDDIMDRIDPKRTGKITFDKFRSVLAADAADAEDD